jgi:hypothetical protein
MTHPKIADAPGHIWRKHTKGWECRWQCRTDLIAKGFTPKSQQLFVGEEPSETEIAFIQDVCRRLQDEMLTFGRGGLPVAATFDGTLRSLINCYQTDPDSRYHKLRYKVRRNTDYKLRRIADAHGDEDLGDISGRTIITWYNEWTAGGVKLSTGKAYCGQLRTLFTFGRSLLAIEDCVRLGMIMHDFKAESGKRGQKGLTSEHVDAIRYKARIHFGWPSLALAQAFQFECTFRQKDIIGEWVPLAEPGISDVIDRTEKWIRGIAWQEIDDNLILRHTTSKKQKDAEVDLKLAPMVIEELREYTGGHPIVMIDSATKKMVVHRHLLPASGPIIICDTNGLPWTDSEFRRKWRKVADAAGVPKDRKNMGSRHGAIEEAIQAGVPVEFVRHAAVHSNVSQTLAYDNSQAKSTARSMEARVEHRKKPKTD